MTKSEKFKMQVRLAEMAQRDYCDYAMIYHVARAAELLSNMDAEMFLEITEDVFNSFEEMDSRVKKLLDDEEEAIA